MKADLYIPLITQDEVGAVRKTWIFEKTVDCRARGILRKGVGKNSTSFDVGDYVNTMIDLVKIRTSEWIQSDRRIASIRNTNEIVYKESQDPSSGGGFSDGSTIFEAHGSTPIFNFDGSLLEYETVLLRSEIQSLVVS